MARYFTREAIEEAIVAINDDKEHLERAKLLTGKFILRVLETPDHKDLIVTYTFDQGRCTNWLYEEDKSPSKKLRDKPFRQMVDGLARVTAKYATFVKLDKGEMDIADTIDSSDYKVEGSKLMLMPLSQAIDSWSRKVRTIPKEY